MEPQLIPAGELLTVPLPFPSLVTVSVLMDWKVALTERFALMLTVHVPVPVQAPDQPEKTEPAAGVAFRLTEVPCTYACVQVEPQLIPTGEEVTVPEPEPVLVT